MTDQPSPRAAAPMPRTLIVLCAAIVLATAAAAGAGVFLRGEGHTQRVTSARGESYLMVTDGIYRNNAQRVVAEGVGWDIVTLFLAVPGMVVALGFAASGSLRGRLALLGLLAYLFYQYLEYAMFWALGPLFPLFVVIFAASTAAFGWTVSLIDIGGLTRLAKREFPRKSIAIFNFVIAAVLLLMWSGRIATALSGRIEGILFGQTTLVVQALDLGFIVPLAVVAGAMLIRRRPLGHLLSLLFIVKAAAMGAAITAMLLVAWSVEGSLEAAPLIFFVAVTAVSVFLGSLAYARIGATSGRDSRG